jgi:DNA recombination protein RmuC
MNEISQAFVSYLQEFLPPDFTLASLVLLLFGVAILFLFTGLIIVIQFTGVRKLQQATSEKLSAAEKKVAETLAHINRQDIREAKLITLLKNERKHAVEKLRLLEEAREQLKLQFSSLAQQIFDEKSVRFSELNRDKLDAILQPFSSQLNSLKQDINEIYRNDSRERTSLKSEILQLRDLNLQINQEANNLTNALRSDTKVQGNWGELVLERVLERSGLRKGIEYETQGGFRDHNNRLLKPDVIIHLPEGKDIIIDSKVSLRSWEKYVNSEHEVQRSRHLTELTAAIRDHVSTLSRKNYPGLTGIHSLDFVLMFMPIEAAFSAAFQQDENLFAEALTSNIIIVTPTTLLATLRTVENIWNYEHQSKNSLEIARRAGIMYDKFRGFVEEMDKIGKQLATCHTTYDSALLKLTRGRGNLIAQAEQLKELGVQVKKEIPKTITDIAELDLKN